MSQKVNELAPVILAEIKKAQKILLHCHPSPDPDSVGSTLAMWHYLKSLGKDVTAINGDSPKYPDFSFFPGYDQIVEKNWFELDLSDYDLFLIQDSGGINLISDLNKVVFPQNLKTIVIDHHFTNPGYGQINLIDSQYPATAQLDYDLFKAWGAEITADMALCLYMGIYGDTGGFKYSNTSSETYTAAAELVKINPNFWKAIFELNNNREPEELKLKGLVFSNIKTYLAGKVAIGVVSFDELKTSGIPNDLRVSDLSSEMISVKGWDLGIAGIEKNPQEVRFSLRTRNEAKYDVSLIAKTAGEGGGHKAAAGTMIAKPVDEAIATLVATIKQLYPEIE